MPLVSKLVRLAANAPAHYKEATRKVNSVSISTTAQVSLQINNKKEEYTSGDIIEGEVILKLAQEIDITEITLKYKIDEITCIRSPKAAPSCAILDVPEGAVQSRRALKHKQRYERKQLRAEQRQDRRNVQAVYRSDCKIYSQEQRIFPTDEENAAIQAKRLTLAPGTHNFSFTIRIPGHEGDNYKVLPPSFNDANRGTIAHSLKATIKRASNFKQNARCEVPINFTPAMNPAANEMSNVITKNMDVNGAEFFNRSSITINSTAAVPYAIQAGSTFPISLGLSSESEVPLTVIEIVGELAALTSITASTFTKKDQRSEVIFTKRGFNASGCNIDLSDYLQSNQIPHEMIPSFQSRYISLDYVLKLHIKFGIDNRAEHSRTITLEKPMPVMGPHKFRNAPPIGIHNAVYEYPHGSGESFLSETSSCSQQEKNPFHDSQVFPLEKEGGQDGVPPIYA